MIFNLITIKYLQRIKKKLKFAEEKIRENLKIKLLRSNQDNLQKKDETKMRKKCKKIVLKKLKVKKNEYREELKSSYGIEKI